MQPEINKQVFEQWLLTDLRDLEQPVLPEGTSEAAKAGINGFYCLQIDSLVDVSQPAYSQIHKLRGRDFTNEHVTEVTQVSQRPWEAKPTRMLMLQLTDGVQHVQGMEYQPIPALHVNIRPGTKILVQGEIVCRLGVLLLKPGNVKVIGGEVELLVEEFSQERVLSKILGEPEDAIQRHSNQIRHLENADQGFENLVGPSDEELLASLEADDQLMRSTEVVYDSGYGSRSEISSFLSRSSVSQGNHASVLAPELEIPTPQVIPARASREMQELADEDFEDIPVDDLDDVIFMEELEAESESASVEQTFQRNPLPSNSASTNPCVNINSSNVASKYNLSISSAEAPAQVSTERAVSVKPQSGAVAGRRFSNRTDSIDSNSSKNCTTVYNPMSSSVNGRPLVKCQPFGNGPFGLAALGQAKESCSSSLERNLRFQHDAKSVSLHSLPFTYLSVLLAQKPAAVKVKVKAFIVTLLGSLSSSTGSWHVKVKIADGTEYLDVDLSNEVLERLIGFSVAEMKVLKKDPDRRQKVAAGLQQCQRALIDLCCIMTIEFDPRHSKAILLALQDVTVEDYIDLEKRIQSRSHY
ncbi:RMI1 protein, partial [Amia calva]|nr:RMI1 protein [Amia calva]